MSARRHIRALLVGLCTALGCGTTLGCSATEEPPETTPTTVTDITLSSIDPGTVVPGSKLVLSGSSFVPDFAGVTKLRLSGTFAGERVELNLGADFVDYDRMEADWFGAASYGLPAEDGEFSGVAVVDSSSNLDGLRHLSAPIDVVLTVRSALAPRLDSVQNDVVFVNDPLVAHGDGFLLGGDEGLTYGVFEGCFTRHGETACNPVAPTEVIGQPLTPFSRDRIVFPFSPYIAGIQPGAFSGSMRIVNRHGLAANGSEFGTEAVATSNSIIEPAVVSITPAVASLGQYVDVSGGGFVGTSPGADPTFAITTIELSGTFTPDGGPAIPASVTLVPEFVAGQLVRYVMNEEDELGQAVDLRTIAGSFDGTARPVVQFGDDTVMGTASQFQLGIGHVKQVVWLNFLPQYVESLRKFGLRAADSLVQARVIGVVRRDFASINVDVRLEEPTDFALYSIVEIGGPDPNGIGLLGYDNTPGKDDGNLRLHDKIGGVNALTQQDGYPGFGGIFVESLFIFSEHPGSTTVDADAGVPIFDELFDPFRPDLNGKPVKVGELNDVPELTTEQCPANNRRDRIACATRVMGNLIGTTVSHEIAHSLGLADPGGEAFHNTGDWNNALMDGGGARSFQERAELLGEGPGHFCSVNYAYLRQILPTNEPDPLTFREECY